MQFIDTHTHIYIDDFNDDREEVVRQAIAAGVDTLLLPNIDVESIVQVKRLTQQFPQNCRPMMGLHPGYVDANWKEALAAIEKELFAGGYIAVGEIGMDLYWDKTFVEEQKHVFAQQVKWAKELRLPIAIHARDAFDPIFDILDELNDENLTGVFHCFTGTVEQAQKVLSYGGFYFGIGGVVTYKNAGLDRVVAELPMDKLVLETDAPYLPPVPHRGKRNESAFLLHVAEKVAEVKNLSLKEVADTTTQNAKSLFRLT